MLTMLLRTSLLAAVRHPALWRRIDISSNRPRHPAYTDAGKDQQEGLHALPAPDRPHEYENNRPGDGGASAVAPVVSASRHLLLLFFCSSPVRKGTRTLESSLHRMSQQFHVLSVYFINGIMRRIPPVSFLIVLMDTTKNCARIYAYFSIIRRVTIFSTKSYGTGLFNGNCTVLFTLL
jgi:hypothetical protein